MPNSQDQMRAEGLCFLFGSNPQPGKVTDEHIQAIQTIGLGPIAPDLVPGDLKLPKDVLDALKEFKRDAQQFIDGLPEELKTWLRQLVTPKKPPSPPVTPKQGSQSGPPPTPPNPTGSKKGTAKDDPSEKKPEGQARGGAEESADLSAVHHAAERQMLQSMAEEADRQEQDWQQDDNGTGPIPEPPAEMRGGNIARVLGQAVSPDRPEQTNQDTLLSGSDRETEPWFMGLLPYFLPLLIALVLWGLVYMVGRVAKSDVDQTMAAFEREQQEQMVKEQVDSLCERPQSVDQLDRYSDCVKAVRKTFAVLPEARQAVDQSKAAQGTTTADAPMDRTTIALISLGLVAILTGGGYLLYRWLRKEWEQFKQEEKEYVGWLRTIFRLLKKLDDFLSEDDEKEDTSDPSTPPPAGGTPPGSGGTP